MFPVHCAYLLFPTFLLAIWRGKQDKRDESKKIWVFIDGHLDEPQELERVVSSFRKMGNDIYQRLSFSSKLSTLQSGLEHKPCIQNVFLRRQESGRKEMS